MILYIGLNKKEYYFNIDIPEIMKWSIVNVDQSIEVYYCIIFVIRF